MNICSQVNQVYLEKITQFQDYPLARREAPAEGRRPEGEGANLDRHLVPYHA